MEDSTRSRTRSVRIVVVGLGAVTSQGGTAEALWAGVKAGRVAIRPVARFDMTGLRTCLGGEVQDRRPPQHPYPHTEAGGEPAVDFALRAAEEAIDHAGLTGAHVPPERWGLVLATTVGGSGSLESWYRALMADKEPDPRLLLAGPPQSVAETVAGILRLGGPAVAVTNSCAAGANAVGLAADLLRSGQADAMLAGGVDAFTEVVFAGFNCLEALSPEPAAPYAGNRRGLSLGEGSGMLLLVRDDIAHRAGIPILAEILGYGLSSDGLHATSPDPRGAGAARAMRAALDVAGLAPEDIGYINGHGTGTPKNDPAETKAIRLALGSAADTVPVSSTKSMIGHLLAAAGAVESIITVKSLQDQVAPPTANYATPDPECDLDYVPNQARSVQMDVALTNNFAFGGANATVAIGRYHLGREPVPVTRERVVITGIAILTETASNQEAVWRNFVSKRRKLEAFSRFRAANVAAQYLPARVLNRLDRLEIVTVSASQLAMTDAGLELTDENRERVGIMVGTALGPMESYERFARPIFREGPAAASPAGFPNVVHNAAAGQASISTGALGATTTLSAGHAAGAAVLGYAYDLLARGQADALVCVAGDTVTESVLRAYRDLGITTPDAKYSLVESGVAVVLERLSVAQSQGARYYGEIRGYGMACDAVGPGRFDPRGAGLERAMRLALCQAGLEPADISVVWSGLTGFRPTDVAERAAIRRVFGGKIEVLAPKLVLGDPLGAGGPLNVVLALKKWEHESRDRTPAPVLVNSSTLGGSHTSLVLTPPRA
jgi:3-oxoacyl-[acyl-carrier-protein] synthase II